MSFFGVYHMLDERLETNVSGVSDQVKEYSKGVPVAVTCKIHIQSLLPIGSPGHGQTMLRDKQRGYLTS